MQFVVLLLIQENFNISLYCFIIVDRIFDISNSTQDVYDEFGQPIVLSAMDGFNGKYLRLP